MLPLRAASSSSWVYPGAKFDFDFANSRYWGGNVISAASGPAARMMQTLVQGAGNSIVQYAPDIYGNLRTFAANVLRITAGYGLWAEGPYTNFALWARDLTNVVWTATTCTVAKNQIGAEGTVNAASSLTSTAGNATVLQAITHASTTFVGSCWIKRISGTGTINMTVDNGATWTPVTVTSSYTQVQIPVQTLANPTFGFQIVTSGDAIAVDMAQCENSPLFATTPLPTTSATVARTTDEPAISDPAGSSPGDGQRFIRTLICTGGPWSMLAIGSGNGYVAGNVFIATDGGVTIRGLAGINNAAGVAQFQANNATSISSANTGNVGLYNINKVAGRANGKGNAVCLNGGVVASNSTNAITAQNAAFTHLGLGNNGAAATPLNGFISRLVWWPFEITDGQMIEYTRSDSAYGNT